MLVAAGCQVVNADIPVRDLWQVVLGSAAITQQLSTVVAAVSVPVYLRLGLLDGHSLLLINIVLLTLGANDWHCWKHQWLCGHGGMSFCSNRQPCLQDSACSMAAEQIAAADNCNSNVQGLSEFASHQVAAACLTSHHFSPGGGSTATV